MTWVPQSRLAVGPSALGHHNPTVWSLACRWWLCFPVRTGEDFFDWNAPLILKSKAWFRQLWVFLQHYSFLPVYKIVAKNIYKIKLGAHTRAHTSLGTHKSAHTSEHTSLRAHTSAHTSFGANAYMSLGKHTSTCMCAFLPRNPIWVLWSNVVQTGWLYIWTDC